jgi:hypothetical protein
MFRQFRDRVLTVPIAIEFIDTRFQSFKKAKKEISHTLESPEQHSDINLSPF